MQKVVGSSPIIRSSESPGKRGFFDAAARRGRGLMGERSRTVLATEQDLQRIFGSERPLFPVRPPSNGDSTPPTEQPPAEEDQPVSSSESRPEPLLFVVVGVHQCPGGPLDPADQEG